jgi:hypothetical protein
MRVYYNPPETYTDETTGEEKPFPPFEWERSQFVKVFESPHAYFKKVEIKYPIGMIVDKRTGHPKLNSKKEPQMSWGLRSVWVLDEEKNEQMKKGLIPKPKNWLDLTKEERVFLNWANQHDFYRRHLVAEDKIVRDQDLELDNVKRRHYERMDQLVKAQEAEQLKVKALIDEVKREREKFEAQLSNVKTSAARVK